MRIRPEHLNAHMEFDHVIQVFENGSVVDDVAAVWAPEVYDNSPEGGPEDIAVSGEGWTLERGWTGQYSYSGPVMHDSEFIGGDLAEHILSTPGYWVAVVVSGPGCDDENCSGSCDNGCDDSYGWVVLHRPF